MLNALSLLLVTTGLSGVMLLVLSSLAKSEVAGIREWRQANLLAVVALLLFAARGVVPDVLSVELANALYLGTITLIFAGFRRFLGLSVPWRLLAAGALAAISGIVFFHHVIESAALRIVSVSLYHGAVCFAIGITLRAPGEPRLRYSFTFTRCAALVLGVGHAWRAGFYLIDFYRPYSLLEGSAYNLAFFAIGTLALPALTLGAVMMANARLIAASAHAADHDHLTGAASRRAFFAFAERELARAERHGSALGLLLVDADHFKHINDTHGHGVGDLVLRDLVERTQQTIRKIDYCARLGGEEFAVLLPDADGRTVLSVAQRLRAALERAPQVEAGAAGVSYTVSIGVAMLRPGEGITSLMARADTALYAAKAGGRNRVEAAPEPVSGNLAEPA
ncbi:diguanylate cyclase (GGDEF)-like protein [Massilia sp. UYP32]|uniref:diguanylate cyclase n=2 Tax=Telluria group TaxID=2895353 RepID=K9DX22_9BURK|nr:diguanylate cyclase (GGDEF) domain-containing protein [Massilia timonae CCUG 45783]